MEFLHILITFLLVLLFMNMLLNLRMLDDQETVENKTDLPLISVLLPVRNEEKNIRTCILSLLEQNYPRLEIIVLDDDSIDNTFQIAKQLAQKSKKLKV
ncbi:MAG: glycosyltransferase, partial [Acidobacteriota bacterium]|nr:glycosyltransferase [Acidobacteriota bacterium]